MVNEVPYMASIGNIDAIIQKIRGAGTPPRFTHEFLSSTLGFRSSNDRGMIKVLRSLGMITNDGAPTERYNAFKNEITGGLALADGLRDGWSNLYLADQSAHERTPTRTPADIQDRDGQVRRGREEDGNNLHGSRETCRFLEPTSITNR